MTDIHAHILPGLDDGAADLDTALEMAALAVDSGVTDLVATPHALPGGCTAGQVLQATDRLRLALEAEGIPLRLHAGMEILGTPDTPDLLEAGQLLCLGRSRCPLVEFPFTDYAATATDLLDELCRRGWRPVVAHPERYLYVQRDPALLELWLQLGCLLQVNKGSLLGRFGPREQRLARSLVHRGMAFAVASDAHGSSFRTTHMDAAVRLLTEEFSPAAARALLSDNPRRLLAGKSLPYAVADPF